MSAFAAALLALAACSPAPRTTAPEVVAPSPAPARESAPAAAQPAPPQRPPSAAAPATGPAADSREASPATKQTQPAAQETHPGTKEGSTSATGPSANGKAPPARPAAAPEKAPRPAAPKAPATTAKAPAPAAPSPATVATAPATSPPAAKPAPLDLRSLEQRLRDTSAIGLMTKLSLKNQVDDLLEKFREYHRGQLKASLAELRHPYELLLMKVLSLLQDGDPGLARDINASREAIWSVLTDRDKFAQYT